MVVGAAEAPVGAFDHVERGRDVEHRELRHRLGCIQRQAVRDTAAAVVAGDGKALVAQLPHQRPHIGGHRALAHLRVLRLVGRGLAVAIAAQVGQHEAEVRRELRHHAVPEHVRLREAVQQQQRRRTDTAADAAAQAPALDGQVERLEAFEAGDGAHGGHVGHVTHLDGQRVQRSAGRSERAKVHDTPRPTAVPRVWSTSGLL